MAWLFTAPASPSWWARALDWPARRRSAPFGWERHPGHVGSDACSDANHLPALPPAGWGRHQLAAGTELATGTRPARVVSGRRSSTGSLRSSRRWAPPCACEAADAFLAVHLIAVRPSGLPAMTTSPSRDAWCPPGQGGGRPRRVIDAGASKRYRRLLFCNQRFSMSTRESLRLPLCSRRVASSGSAPVAPLRVAGRSFAVVGGAAVPWFRRDGLGWRCSWATSPIVVQSLTAELSLRRAAVVLSHARRARGSHLLRTAPSLFATDAPVHHPRQSFGMLRAIRLLAARRTTSRTLEPGAPSTAGSRRSEERRAATTRLARGRRSLPTCCSRAALRARYASASRPDAPHAAHRLLSIERARSTPRTTSNPDADTGPC